MTIVGEKLPVLGQPAECGFRSHSGRSRRFWTQEAILDLKPRFAGKWNALPLLLRHAPRSSSPQTGLELRTNADSNLSVLGLTPARGRLNYMLKVQDQDRIPS